MGRTIRFASLLAATIIGCSSGTLGPTSSVGSVGAGSTGLAGVGAGSNDGLGSGSEMVATGRATGSGPVARSRDGGGRDAGLDDDLDAGGVPLH